MTIFFRSSWSKKNFLRVLRSEGLKFVFSKRRASKIWGGGQWGPILKNSTPSPRKRRKTPSSATFRATDAWGLTQSIRPILIIKKSVYFDYLLSHTFCFLEIYTTAWWNLKSGLSFNVRDDYFVEFLSSEITK